MLQLAHRVTGGVPWANLHLQFWLSLLPFATAGEARTIFQACLRRYTTRCSL